MKRLTEFYCHQCKDELTKSVAMDDQHAWCDSCKAVVVRSWFRCQPWIVGVAIVVLGLWIINP